MPEGICGRGTRDLNDVVVRLDRIKGGREGTKIVPLTENWSCPAFDLSIYVGFRSGFNAALDLTSVFLVSACPMIARCVDFCSQRSRKASRLPASGSTGCNYHAGGGHCSGRSWQIEATTRKHVPTGGVQSVSAGRN